MTLKENRRPSKKVWGKIVPMLFVAMMIGWAGTASAVTKTYNFSSDSGLHLTLTSKTEFLVWSQFNWATCAAPNTCPYSVPAQSDILNSVTITFSELGAGVIDPDGTITIDNLDLYHNTNAGFGGFFSVLGLTDIGVMTSVAGSGNMTAGVVTTWGAGLSGQVHNELTCTDISGVWCGPSGAAGGLPPSGVLDVTHLNPAPGFAIDTAGSPFAGGTNPASAPMTFSNNYDTVTFEITIDVLDANNRQFYGLTGQAEGTGALVPAMSSAVQMLLVAVMAMVGIHTMGAGRGREQTAFFS